jgi:hypothetical protein
MSVLSSIFHLLSNVIILIAVIQYVSKRPFTEGFLMLIGSVISILQSSLYVFGLPFLSEMGGMGDAREYYLGYMKIAAEISTLGALAFGIGLLMLIRKVLTPALLEGTSGPNDLSR